MLGPLPWWKEFNKLNGTLLAPVLVNSDTVAARGRHALGVTCYFPAKIFTTPLASWASRIVYVHAVTYNKRHVSKSNLMVIFTGSYQFV